MKGGGGRKCPRDFFSFLFFLVITLFTGMRSVSFHVISSFQPQYIDIMGKGDERGMTVEVN